MTKLDAAAAIADAIDDDINFTAVSIALNCNKNESFGVKIFAAAYAFLFGIIYILVNYYSYRIMLKKTPYVYDGKVFPF